MIYCPECYSENPDNTIFCENCGCPFNITTKKSEEVLLKDRYKLISPLSAGGVGEIFLTYDIRLNNTCVIKKIYKEGLKDLPLEKREEIVKPFEREAQILANLRHPNLPCVTDYFIEEDYCYLVMDYVEGDDLEVILDETCKLEESYKGIHERQVLEWGIQICRVLEYLHSQKPPIIHGDIKSANLIIRNSDKLIILVDFGTATIQTVVGQEKEATGTDGYAPPEQYLGRQEIRSDIYSLSATMYELLSTNLPEESFKFAPIRELVPEVSKDTEAILEKCLSYRVQERYADAAELKQALLKAYKKNFRPSRKHKTGELILKTGELKEREDRKKKEIVNVLVVDDDVNVRVTFKSISRMFKGVKLIGTANNGGEAIEKIKSGEVSPHVILMDMDMPVMNGIEATRKVKEILPSVKVIMLTAHVDRNTFMSSFKAGATGYIVKGDTSWADLEKYIKSAVDGGNPYISCCKYFTFTCCSTS